jgi:hypothetical protein
MTADQRFWVREEQEGRSHWSGPFSSQAEAEREAERRSHSNFAEVVAGRPGAVGAAVSEFYGGTRHAPGGIVRPFTPPPDEVLIPA